MQTQAFGENHTQNGPTITPKPDAIAGPLSTERIYRALMIIVALCPPKPNELDRTVRTCIFRAVFGV